MDDVQRLPPPITARDVLRILRRRFRIMLFVFCTIVAATLILTARMKRVYESQARLLLSSAGAPQIQGSLISLLGGAGNPSLETDIEKIRSRNFMTEVITKAHLKTDPITLTTRVRLSSGPGPDILSVSVRADSPAEAVRTANVITRIFKDTMIQEAEDRADQSSYHLRRAKSLAQAEKEQAQNAYHDFVTKLGISDPAAYYASRTAVTIATQNALDDTIKDLKIQTKRREALAAQTQTTAPEIVTGYSQNKNSVIDDYQRQLTELENRKATLLFDYLPDAPEIREVDNKIAVTKRLLKSAFDNFYSKGSKSVARNPDYSNAISGLKAAELAIKNDEAIIRANTTLMNRLKEEQKRLAPEKSKFEDLARERTAKITAFERLSNGINDTDIQKLTTVPSIQVLDEAMPNAIPISPRPLLNFMLSIGAGLFFGLAAAVIAEYFATKPLDDSAGYLPQVAGVPLLGSVYTALPAPRSGSDILPSAAHHNIEDAFREVGYCLTHRISGSGTPVVVLTGTRSDDTTASVAAHLSATLVRDGLRVTLVDADRAHPRLNHVFGAPDAPGMADVLAGRCRALDILHVGADGNLRFLAAGAMNDSTPLTEKGLRSLFKDISSDTDLVVVSAPSIWSVRNITLLEKATDGMVLIAPADGREAENVARARRLLTNGYQPRILGVVINDAKPETGIALPQTAVSTLPVESEEIER